MPALVEWDAQRWGSPVPGRAEYLATEILAWEEAEAVIQHRQG